MSIIEASGKLERYMVRQALDRDRVSADWTERMYPAGAVHHRDGFRGSVLFRVFLLADSLQTDHAFWPTDRFDAIAPTFRLLFGTANELPAQPAPTAAELIGTGWLYALHGRSSITRGRLWQAEYMLGNVRDQVLALACLRHGLPAIQGRGARPPSGADGQFPTNPYANRGRISLL